MKISKQKERRLLSLPAVQLGVATAEDGGSACLAELAGLCAASTELCSCLSLKYNANFISCSTKNIIFKNTHFVFVGKVYKLHISTTNIITTPTKLPSMQMIEKQTLLQYNCPDYAAKTIFHSNKPSSQCARVRYCTKYIQHKNILEEKFALSVVTCMWFSNLIISYVLLFSCDTYTVQKK